MPDCNECKSRPSNVPYIVHEASVARLERMAKRLTIAVVISILALVASNCLWLYYLSLYDFESYEINSDGGGNANFIGNDGDIYNGAN